MQMQSCHLFWHKSTLSIILKRELADCTPSREVPVLYVKRPAIFGGDLEIDLGGSVHPVRMLPVSGKDVRNLRFGLIYGPKRKRVRFRAPDVATYDNWEMVLEVAVEKAAAERPTFPTWPYPGTSPSLSAVEDGYTSEEFGFSDGDGSDESKRGDARYKPPQVKQNVMTGSFVDFIDPPSPDETSSGDTVEDDYDRTPSSDSEYQVSVMPLAREVEVTRPTIVSSATKQHKVVVQHLKHEVEWCSNKPQFEHPFATRLRLQLISNSGIEATKFSIADYLTWFRGDQALLKCKD
ncbi:RxLR effector candidate protein [Phytophthora palmivora]|uniref:RxLR effector candidate protein n=1 Tax=Phytophthora palmivora TaxID=4796 RepID=A0A2P4YMM1_9STRA|nr:RxLR effector candidate protein [Phytophthora palmivora]